MQNPIPFSGLFATMSIADIQNFIGRLPKGQRANASLVLMFTLNACHAVVEDELVDALS
jgi:hypothetical protein